MHNIIVTGGSRGLGLAMARVLAAGGYRVIAVARRQSDEFLAAQKELQGQAQGALHFMACDLSDIDTLPKLIDDIRKNHGPVYGLVNNAGIGTAGILANMHVRQIEQLIRLNTLSPITLTKHAIKSMIAQGEGRIVNIASILGATGYSGLSVYGATKAALIGFTKSLAREVGPLNITVNAVAPGFIETDLTQSLNDQDKAKIISRSALRRLAGRDDVAHAVAFLLSRNAQNITGTVVTVDAGNTA